MNKSLLAFKLVVLAWLCAANVQAIVRYVKPGSASTVWQTQTNVYPDLQAALTAAVSGDEIWMAAGTYKPTTGTDRSISFNLKNGVAVYGGFSGTETLKTQRNWVKNPTILSGDIGVAGTDTDNSYTVVKAIGTSTAPLDNTTRLDGMIVEKGYANTHGGGAYLSYANPNIANNIFRYNSSLNYGGAVYAINSNSVFANTLFWTNKANSFGGAVYTERGLTFIHCIFANNRSEYQGGAIFNGYASEFSTITNCIAWGNSAKNYDPQFCNTTTTYSCVEGGYSGTGNISDDPLFIDATIGDYRLNATSPCLDKGLNSAIPIGLTNDFYGNIRLSGATVDMGFMEGGVITPIVKTPANKTVLPGTTTSIVLEWAWVSTQPIGITGYEIELQLNGGASQLIPSTTTSYTINNLTQGSVYKWRVRGTNGSAPKEWSPWALVSIKHGTPLYVKPGGTGNGLTWATAMGSIQAAIDAAVYSDVIWVAAGTYKPTLGTDRTISINLKNGVAIYGGFAGTETELAQRNWVVNPTILSGDIGIEGTDTDNSFNVVKAIGTGATPLDLTTRLDGVILEKGNNLSAGFSGGGLYMFYADPTIVNTIFRKNNSGLPGGALYSEYSNAVFINTIFALNKSPQQGGAVYSQSSSLSFVHCAFLNNQSLSYGGAVYNYGTTTNITNSIAWGNTSNTSDQQFYGNFTCSYSCIEGGYNGPGNIGSDPLIIDTENGDYRLNNQSPCIEKGLNTVTPTWLALDYYGNNRQAGTSVDIGHSEGGILTPIAKLPVNNSALPRGATTAILTWEWPQTQPTGITGYEIELQLNSGASQYLNSSTTTYTLNGIVELSTYKWRVRVIDGTSIKNWSPWAIFKVGHSNPFYVKPGGTGNGSSWAQAMGSLQTAIDAAVFGDEVWIAAGTYNPTSGTDRTISFNLKDGVAIYGGFAGTEIQLSQRNWLTNPTILSGDIGVAGTDTDNSYTVVKAVGTSSTSLSNTTRLDGVIIEKGYNTQSGGGLVLIYANPIIANTIFRNNYAILDGGAVFSNTGNSVFANTLFVSNKANNAGGAVRAHSALTFTNCTFVNNQASVFSTIFSQTSSCKITNCIAWGNVKNTSNQFSSITCMYSCVEGGYTGTGNINSDPLFIDAGNGDFRIKDSSPCIDKGVNGSVPGWLNTDFLGNTRLLGSTVDMGITEGGVVTPTPKAPINNAFLAGTTTSVILEWEWQPAQPTGVTGYELEIQFNGGQSQFYTIALNTTYTLNGINPASVYKWRVRGINGTTFKDWSSWVTFTVRHATPLYVKTGGTGNGLSWNTAMGSIQMAIDEAFYGDTIWVAAGTYKPTTGTDRAISFNLKNGVAIFGGFIGTETLLAQRNWNVNPTILSGDIGVSGTNTDNSYRVIIAVGTSTSTFDNNTRLDGVVIEHGYSDGNDAAGLYLRYAHPTIANTIFRNNNSNRWGGACYADNSNAIFTNTLFVSNNAYRGGAVHTESALTFTHCTFANNQASDMGGAVYSNKNGTTITNCVAWGNNSSGGYKQFYNTTCTYSSVQGSYNGIGNISSDPMFMDSANSDYRLQVASPCIDKGLNSSAPTWLTTDFYGNARLIGTTVDMGIAEGSVVVPSIKAPINNTVLAGTSTSTVLEWEWQSSLPNGVNGYEIEMQLNGVTQFFTSETTVYTLNGIISGYSYKWRVRGIDGTTFKNWSQWATFAVRHTAPLYVKTGGTGSGLSWSSALGSIQTAIDAAFSGDTIWVAAGTYKPITGTDRSISFSLKNGVAIYGGFAGSETQLTQRNWVANPTILSGDIGVDGTDADNSYSVVKAIGTSTALLDNTTRLDGVIVEKGYSNTDGGGAYLSYASPTIANTIFRNNYASDDGGAVYAINSNSVFANTLFVYNKVNSCGGAVYTESILTFTHCTFANNSSEDWGGAIYNGVFSSTFTNSIAWGNIARGSYQQFNSVNCTYSCLQGGGSGTGNISSDPLFADDANGNFRLQQSSPCINKALATGTPAWLTADLDLLPRSINGGADMGAYEAAYVSSTTPVDNAVHTQKAGFGSYLNWDLDKTLSETTKQSIKCDIELWKNGVPGTILAKGTGTGLDQLWIMPVNFGAAYQWRVGVKTASHTYWSTPATLYIGREKPIFVKTSGTGDGSSWANALGSVSSALEIANPGDRIWVAAGTYKPSGSGRDAAFKMKPFVELLGGFVESDNLGTGRNPELNVTILSGDLGMANVDSDNAYHVINNAYTEGSPLIGAVIDGFTITGGNAGSTNGGGMFNTYANPTVRYCKFTGNKAASGGAIANTASSPSVINSLLVKNTASSKGGAIYSDVSSTPMIVNSTIANNIATSGGGISGNGTVGNTIVYANTGGQIEGTPTVTYSCVQDGFTGTANINASPRFKDADNGNYAIGPFSSCFDKGNSELITTDFATSDLSFGEMRNFVSSVDIGAYELSYPDIAARVEVTQATPANAAIDIDYSAPIVLTFNEPATISDTLGITMASGIAFKSINLSDDKKTLTLTPDVNWPFNSSQKLVIANGAILLADNSNFRMVDYECGFDIRSCVPATLSIELLKPETCPGTLAQLTAITTGDVQNYKWLFNQTVVANDTSAFTIQKLTADSIGVYHCNVMDMCGNTVSAQSTVKFVDGVLNPVIVKKWNDVYLVDNSSKRFSDYQWYFNGASIDLTSQYITLGTLSTGQLLYVTAIDSNTGCRSTSDIIDGSAALKSVSVYPNPVVSSQPVEIQLPTTATDTKVRLFDASGNLKVEESISGVDHYSFDKTNFVPGVYLMEIVEAEEKTIVKLIIQ